MHSANKGGHCEGCQCCAPSASAPAKQWRELTDDPATWPEDGSTVLLSDADGHMRLWIWAAVWSSAGRDARDDGFAHWMTIPPPPKVARPSGGREVSQCADVMVTCGHCRGTSEVSAPALTEVLSALSIDKWTTATQLARVLGKSPENVCNMLAALRRLWRVERRKRARGKGYEWRRYPPHCDEDRERRQ